MTTAVIESLNQTATATRYSSGMQNVMALGAVKVVGIVQSWALVTSIGEAEVKREQEALAELEWDKRFTTSSPQLNALRALIDEGRKQYASGETEDIVGDTFA